MMDQSPGLETPREIAQFIQHQSFGEITRNSISNIWNRLLFLVS